MLVHEEPRLGTGELGQLELDLVLHDEAPLAVETDRQGERDGPLLRGLLHALDDVVERLRKLGVGRALAGGFVRRMKVTYAVTQGYTDGQWVLTISPGMTGMGGGALGVSKSKKEMVSIYESVAEALARHGHVAVPQGIQGSPADGQAPPAGGGNPW